MNDGTTAPDRRSLKSALLLTACTLAALLPFIAKPLHIDDPMYVWAAQHIVQHPLDPYGFEVNWYGVAQPMAEVMKNPPLTSYYLAAMSPLTRWGERGMHLIMLLPAVGVVLGTYRLARELGSQPVLAALATLLTPVFLISANTIMCDVAMLCGYVWAIFFWLRGLRRERVSDLMVAALLIAVATLTKYFGASLLPLLIAYALLKAPRRWRLWLPPLALPVALLIAYQIWTRGIYGHGLLLDAAAYASASRDSIAPPLLPRMLTACAFFGGGALTVALLPLCRLRWYAVVLWIAGGVTVPLVLRAADPYVQHPIRGDQGTAGLYWAELGIFVTAGLVMLAFVAWEVRRRWPDPDALLLLLWILGTLAFAGGVNWSVNGRSVLAAAPAAAIMAARWGPRLNGWRRGATVAALGIGGVLSILVARADAAHARAARRAAYAVHQRYKDHPGQVWFVGHWGFQYYMEQLGHRAIDPARPEWKTGDLLVQPRNNSYTFYFEGDLPIVFRFGVPALGYLATMESAVHAGFYADNWGPLPFGFGNVPPDQYVVMRIQGPIRPVVRR